MFNLAKTLNDLKTDAKLTELDLSQQKTVDEKADAKAEAKCVATLTERSDAVCALAVLPDGRLASGSRGITYGAIKLWDTQSGNCQETLTLDDSNNRFSHVTALAVLPDGRLASGNSRGASSFSLTLNFDNSIQLWDTKSGNCQKTLSRRHPAEIHALAVLPDGRLASGSHDNNIQLWDTKSGDCRQTLRGHSSRVTALAVLPDGRLASGSHDKSIKLWDAKRGACRATLTGHSNGIWALAVLPDGRLASASSDKSIKLWDTKSGACRLTLTGHSEPVTALAVLSDGRLTSGGSGGYGNSNEIKLWDTKSGVCQQTLSGHSSNVNALAVLPDGRLASGSEDQSIKLWDLKAMPERALRLSDVAPVLSALPNSTVQWLNLQNVQLADEAVPALSKLISDTKYLTTLDLRRTAITRTGMEALHKTNRQRSTPLKLLHEAMPNILAAEKKAEEAARPAPAPSRPTPEENNHLFNLSKTLNDLKTDTKLTELDLSQQKTSDEKVDAKTEAKCVATLTGHSRYVTTLAVLPDGRLASGSYDRRIKLWDTKSNDCQQTLTGHSLVVTALAVLPDGRLVSGSEDHSIKLWDTKSGDCKTLFGHSGSVHALTVLPDGQLASGSNDRSIKLWDTQSGDCRQTLRGHSSRVNALAVLPDGRLASGSNDRSIKLWDTNSGDCQLTFTTGHPTSWGVTTLVVLPDGRLASASNNNSIKLWDTKSGECQLTLTGHSNHVRALAVLPDGRLVSGSADNSIKLWDIKSGDCQLTLTGHSDPVKALAVLLDGRLTSGSLDKSIKLWDVGAMPERALRLSDVAPVLTVVSNSAVQRLNLQNIILADEAVPVLGKLVSDAKHLTTLDLRHTAITRTGMEALHKTNRQRSAPLQLLHETMPDILAAEKKAEEAARAAPAPRLTPEENYHLFNLSKTLNDLKTDAKLTELDLSQQKAVDEKADTKAEAKCVATITGHSNTVTALAVLPDGRLASGSEDHSIKLWDTQSGDCQQTLTGHSHWVTALAVLSDGRLASGSGGYMHGEIKLWDTKSGDCRLTLIGHSVHANTVSALGVLPDGRLYGAGMSYYQPIHVTALAVLPDGRLASGSSDKSIKLWDTRIGECQHTFTEPYSVTALAVLPDGRLASGSGNEDSNIRLWNTKSSDCRANLGLGTAAGHSHQVILALAGHSQVILALAMLPDGRLASGSADKSIKLWDTQSGHCQLTLTGHSWGVNALAVLPDGRLASSGSYDKSIKLWDTKSGACQLTLSGHSGPVQALAMLPDGRLASGSGDHSIKLWDVKPPNRALRVSDIALVLTTLPNSAVQRLNLQNTVLADDEISVLCNVVLDAKQLTVLDLRRTALTRAGIEGLHKLNSLRPNPLQILHEAMPDILAAEKKAEEAARPAPTPAPAPPAPAVAKQGHGVNTLLGEVNRKLDRLQFGQQEGNREIVQQVGDLRRDQAQAQEKQQPTSPSSPTSPALSFSYTISYADLEIQQELGRGGFGIVHRGTWRQVVDVAIKELLITAPTSDALQEFNSEIQVMARLRCPYIVQFYGACMGNPKYALVMEYMPGGSLYSLLHNGQTLAWEARYRIIHDIACGLAFLHAEHILHLDLKSLNVLLGINSQGEPCAKLCDFGLARIRTETLTTQSSAKATPSGTPAWTGPELAKRGARPTEKSDIYSLGVTFWEVAAREIPFADARGDASLIREWVRDGDRPAKDDKFPADCPPKLASLVRFCWHGDPSRRPTAGQVVSYLRSDAKDFEEFANRPAAASPTAASALPSAKRG